MAFISILYQKGFPMISIEITDRKNFMNRLFLDDTFDSFFLSEATFITFNTFHIDGVLKKSYYSTEEREVSDLMNRSFSTWRQVRPFCLELVRGTHTPLEFRIVFRLSDSNVEKLLRQAGLSLSFTDIGGLFLNLHYRDGKLICTSGTALTFFTLDKSLEHIWDKMLQKFFVSTHLN